MTDEQGRLGKTVKTWLQCLIVGGHGSECWQQPRRLRGAEGALAVEIMLR